MQIDERKNPRKSTRLVLLAMTCAFTGSLTGCDKELPSGGSLRLPYNSLCEAKTIVMEDVVTACSEGQRVLFRPEKRGSEELSVIFAAQYCNPEYAVALTNGAVSCVFKPIDLGYIPEAMGKKPTVTK